MKFSQKTRTHINNSFDNKLSELLDSTLIVLFEDLIDSADLLQNSFWHPLGFININLPFDKNEYQFRIHLWPKNMIRPKYYIHNHYYNFSSYVATGSIVNTIYEVQDKISTHTNCIYVGEYSDDLSTRILKKTEKCISAEILSNNKIIAKTFYDMQSHEFHDSNVDSKDLTITMMRISQSESENKKPLILGDLKGEECLIYDRKPCKKEKLVSLLKEGVRLLNEKDI